MPILARGAAMRFLLTRSYDWLNTPKDALVARKDPVDYVRRLRFHQGRASIADYGPSERLRHERPKTESSSIATAPAREIRAPAAGGPSSSRANHRKEIYGGEQQTTNNRMELMAAISALEALKKKSRVDLHTDSPYVRNGITSVDSRLEEERLEDSRQKACQECRAVAGTRRGTAPCTMSLALAEGPCRPPRERARRRIGAHRAWRRSRLALQRNFPPTN